MSVRRRIVVPGLSVLPMALLPMALGPDGLRAHAAAQSGSTAQPETVCTVSDERLTELSGLAVGPNEWYAVNDGGEHLRVFVLGTDCTVRKVINNSTDPYDVEDLARAEDGTLWLADTGDNSGRRATVALHALRANGESTLYRLTYPTERYNAEALVLGEDGTPYIFTKTVVGDSGVYRPAAPLDSPGPTPLEKVGAVHLSGTDTPGGPVRGVSSLLVTAAAFNRDHTVLAVRTYTDAYLYPAPNGDVSQAIEREPVRIPLPHEAQGEAVAFRDDGTLLSASEGVGEPVRAIPGAAARVSGTSRAAPDAPPQRGAASGATDDGVGLPMIPAVVVAGIIAVGVVFVFRRMRRRD